MHKVGLMVNKKVLLFIFTLIALFFSYSFATTSSKCLLDQKYFEQGVVFLTPGGANYTLGYWWNRLGMRYTLGYVPKSLFGSQIELRFRLIDKIKYRHSLSFGLGSSIMSRGKIFPEPQHYYHYVAGFYNFRYKHFFSQLGIGGGFGTISSPRALFQCGFIFTNKSSEILP